MEEIKIYTICAAAIVSIVLAVYILIRSHFRTVAKNDIYLCVEFFLRNLHELSFYHPQKHRSFIEYHNLYAQLKKNRYKWYFNDRWREYINTFLTDYEKADAFIKAFSAYMGEDHYFSHSEYIECKTLANFDSFRSYIDKHFMKHVNKVEMSSFSQKEQYIEQLDSDYSDIPQRHNLIFVAEELKRNKEFFDTVMPYPLDQQQRESIVKLEDNALVISSAGSGKTSTMVGKIKYLVERRNIDPARILPLTFARKATEELTERLGYENRGLKSHTFHGFAKHIVEDTTGKRQSICPKNTLLQCFYHQAEINPNFKEAINTFLTEKKSLTKDEFEYHSAKEYLSDRALYGIQAPFLDMDSRIIFTKSEEEKKICTFLSMNNVPFRYECPYFRDTTTQYRRQYYPDFTIYVQRNGQWQFVILEHFGIDANGNVPQWFGDGKRGGYLQANQEYQDGIQWKRNINANYGVTLLETTSAMFHDGTIFQRLTEQLQNMGVPMSPMTEEQKFEKLVRRNKQMENALMELIETFISLMKSNRSSFESILETIKQETHNEAFVERSRFMLYEIFSPIYNDYCETLKERKQVDYTDLILMATDLCNEAKYIPNFDYILIDEFQDISVARFKFLQALRTKRPLTKLYCVGDDWQSIFRFAGSDLTLFSDFEEYFGYTEKCKIETTYRFGNPMINISSRFILKNEKQVPKEIVPYSSNANTSLSIHEYSDKQSPSQLDVVKRLISDIPEKETIMLMARYHADVNFIPAACIIAKDDKQRVTKIRIGGRNMDFNTIHASKGLEADNVILVNCSQDGNGFPSKISDDPILGYVLSKPEKYPFAEERRLFYVAITRAKRHCFILYKDTCPSPFISDIDTAHSTKHVMVCPMCGNGTLRVMKSGETQFNKWALYGCTNRTAGCPYTWFVNYQSESDIFIQYGGLPHA